MPFVIPNLADAGFAGQAAPDSGDIDIMAAGSARTGVISGCAVSAQAVPDMTVAVAAGVAMIRGVQVAVAANPVLGISAADPTNARIDLIYVLAAGTPTVAVGTAAANASYPARPANSCILAAIYVPALDSTINTNQITPKGVDLTPLVNYQAVTFGVSPYTVKTTDRVLAVDTTSGNISIVMLNATLVPAGTTYLVQRTTSGAATVTISTTAGQTINGAATYLLPSQWQEVEITATPTGWLATGAGTASGQVLTNVMTTLGDLIKGGVAGLAARLGIGTANQVLTVNSGGTDIVWATPPASLTNPMVGVGQMIRGGASGLPTLVSGPVAGQYLGATGSPAIPIWTAGPGASVMNLFIAASNATAVEKAVASAICTGTGDQTIINSALGSGSCMVTLSSGSFNVSSTINLQTNGHIVGQGKGATIMNASAGVDVFSAANNTSGFSIQNLSINSGRHGIACLAGEIFDFSIRDVYFGSVTGSGFVANAVERGNYERLYFQQCGADGIFLANGAALNSRCERLYIANCIFDGVGGCGIRLGVPNGTGAFNVNNCGDGIILNPVFLGVGQHGCLILQCRFMQIINLNSENCSQATTNTYDVVHIGPTNYQGFQLRGGEATYSGAFPNAHRYGVYTECPNSLIENVDATGLTAGFSLQGSPLIAQDISGTFTALTHTSYPGAHQFINSRYAQPIADGHTYETTYRGLTGLGLTMWLMDSNGVGTGTSGAFRVRDGAGNEIFRVDSNGQVHVKPQTGTASSTTVHADL